MLVRHLRILLILHLWILVLLLLLHLLQLIQQLLSGLWTISVGCYLLRRGRLNHPRRRLLGRGPLGRTLILPAFLLLTVVPVLITTVRSID